MLNFLRDFVTGGPDTGLESLVSYHAQNKLPALCAVAQSTITAGKLDYWTAPVFIDTVSEIRQCMIDAGINKISLNSDFVFVLQGEYSKILLMRVKDYV